MRSLVSALSLGACTVMGTAILLPWLTGAKRTFLDIFFEANREGVFLKWSAPLFCLSAVIGIVLGVQLVRKALSRMLMRPSHTR